MMLCRFEAPLTGSGGAGVGLVLDEEIVDLTRAIPQLPPNPVDILAAGMAGIETIERGAQSAPRLKLKDVKLKAPVLRPGKILGIGHHLHQRPLRSCDHACGIDRSRL